MTAAVLHVASLFFLLLKTLLVHLGMQSVLLLANYFVIKVDALSLDDLLCYSCIVNLLFVL